MNRRGFFSVTVAPFIVAAFKGKEVGDICYVPRTGERFILTESGIKRLTGWHPELIVKDDIMETQQELNELRSKIMEQNRPSTVFLNRLEKKP